ncbi:hypothetical protein AOLI_G00244150 [Acnodon oligacanthus]
MRLSSCLNTAKTEPSSIGGLGLIRRWLCGFYPAGIFSFLLFSFQPEKTTALITHAKAVRQTIPGFWKAYTPESRGPVSLSKPHAQDSDTAYSSTLGPFSGSPRPPAKPLIAVLQVFNPPAQGNLRASTSPPELAPSGAEGNPDLAGCLEKAQTLIIHWDLCERFTRSFSLRPSPLTVTKAPWKSSHFPDLLCYISSGRRDMR